MEVAHSTAIIPVSDFDGNLFASPGGVFLRDGSSTWRDSKLGSL